MDPYHNGYTRPPPNYHYREDLTPNQPWNTRATMMPKNSYDYRTGFEQHSRRLRPWGLHNERTESWNYETESARLQPEAESKAPFYVGPAYHYIQPEYYHGFRPYDYGNYPSQNHISPHRDFLSRAPNTQISSPEAHSREGTALRSSVKSYQDIPRRSASPISARFSRRRPRNSEGRGSTAAAATRMRRYMPTTSRVERARRQSPIGRTQSKWHRAVRASSIDSRPSYR
ncbi:BgTH12-00759 [Blumeria graminis f. sp. triticale]|uniref:BgtAc-30769 n=3 Tax=Blumeria graminis TaxID=34373 RepID=A0A9X9QFN6_BLUGR|nr:hypothetical protein BGT96224_Ac30769 [Blumeria graminis f. sp. tritici 96224]CAD6505267.1 BgTH12-00759 [Blumeria graminis f. sp. triticale]VDB93275.1 BgtAc-30769 [Blumeria graminis f. sp. tritici]